MSIDIKQRLTLVQACLALAVLVPATIALYVFTARSLTDENDRKLDSTLDRASQSVLSQLKKGVLVRFDDEASPFAAMRPFEDMVALVRGNGALVLPSPWLPAIDPSELARVLTRGGETVAITWDSQTGSDEDSPRQLRVRCVPIPQFRSADLASVSEPVRRTVLAECPEGAFLRSETETECGRCVTEVRLLAGDGLVELEIRDDGILIERDEKTLPNRLPPDLEESLLRTGIDPSGEIMGWRTSDGQLLARIALTDPRGRPEFAVNRYGEAFVVSADGDVLDSDSDSSLWLIAAVDDQNVYEAKRTLLLALALGAPVVWLLIVGIGWFVARRAFVPVGQIVRTANEIDTRNLRRRLPVDGVDDELTRISKTINRMLDRLEAGLEREKRFAGDASHELRGPLAKILSEIEVTLARGRSPDQYVDSLGNCRSYARSLQQIAESLLLLSTLDRGGATCKKQDIDFSEPILAAVSSFDEDERTRLELDLDAPDTPLVVAAEPALLRVAIQNLIRNALHYSEPLRPVEIHASCAGKMATVAIRDHGSGIPDQKIEQAFERFARIDRSRSRDTGGAGLGLSIVREITTLHNGSVELRNHPGGGLVATISIPLVRAAGPAPRAAATSSR